MIPQNVTLENLLSTRFGSALGQAAHAAKSAVLYATNLDLALAAVELMRSSIKPAGKAAWMAALTIGSCVRAFSIGLAYSSLNDTTQMSGQSSNLSYSETYIATGCVLALAVIYKITHAAVNQIKRDIIESEKAATYKHTSSRSQISSS